MTPDLATRPVRVWDLPTRIFHWLLALLVVGSIVSAKIGGNAMQWHIRSGLMIMVLLLFRLAWGFIGGRWSRFRSFLYAPRDVLAYLRGDSGPGGRFDVGHSPLGALSVFALLALLIAQVATGLVADDEIATTGPLNRFVATATAQLATGWHKAFGQYLIVLLVAAHVGAVVYYLRTKRRNLIAPMWHGDKLLAPDTPASADSARLRALALLLVAAGLALAGWIYRQGG
jgi:cytochrome b